MPDRDRRLVDFAPGDAVENAVFAVAGLSLKTAGSGKPFLQLKLRDRTGEARAKLWNAPDDIADQLADAKLVQVSGYVDNGARYRGDFVLSSVAPHPEPDDLSPYLPVLSDDHAAHRARFVDLVRSVKQPQLRALLKEIFGAGSEWWPRFQTAPAAKTMHHTARGGLLEHSGEVALLCDRVCATLPHLDRDLLVTAALLHDVGKLEEMDGELRAGEYTHAGNLVGHVVLGTCLVAGAAEKLSDFPPRLKHELMHLILSHHGEPEWGAARRPMCAEALVLSLCDLMSAKVAQCHQAASDENDFAPLKNWHGTPNSPHHNVYVGLMRELMNGDESL